MGASLKEKAAHHEQISSPRCVLPVICCYSASDRRYRLYLRSHEGGNGMTGCYLEDFYLQKEVNGYETYAFNECGRIDGSYPYEVKWIADIYPARNSSEKAVIDVRKEGETDTIRYSVKHSDEPGECFLLTFIDNDGKCEAVTNLYL
ncbi:hypothetical protein V5799_004089 [Amblyomma americanum]|uniref:Uncharacterized protein n=1 Tax=Amblyomma americanum TaxID=6943 RepID=A0AAQ4D737_AMBAM